MELEVRVRRLERELALLRHRDRRWRGAGIIAVVVAVACQTGTAKLDGYVRVGEPIVIGNTTITGNGVLVQDSAGGARLATTGLDLATGGDGHTRVGLTASKLRFVNRDVTAELEADANAASLELVDGIHTRAAIEATPHGATAELTTDGSAARLEVGR
jgi:hypothetical protein